MDGSVSAVLPSFTVMRVHTSLSAVQLDSHSPYEDHDIDWHWLTFTICVVSVVEDTVYGQPEALHRKRVMGIGVGLNQASPCMGCVTSSELFNSNRRPLQKYVPLLNSTARVPGNNGDRSPNREPGTHPSNSRHHFHSCTFPLFRLFLFLLSVMSFFSPSLKASHVSCLAGNHVSDPEYWTASLLLQEQWQY